MENLEEIIVNAGNDPMLFVPFDENLTTEDENNVIASEEIINNVEIIAISEVSINNPVENDGDPREDNSLVGTKNQNTNNNEVNNETTDQTTVATKRKVRKRIRNEALWKCNERKRKHQAGEAYFSKRKKQVPAKSISNKKDCLNSCKFKCSKQITYDMRKTLFDSYYKLSTQYEKHLYLLQITKRLVKQRKTRKDDYENSSRRLYTFNYFFPVKGNMIRVCKQFFLGTLSISQKPVYNAHTGKDANEVPKKDGRGKSITSNRRLPAEMLNDVMTHIKLFPTIEAHYCRSRTNRQYLEPNLSVPKMYYLYKIWCNENEKTPVKLSMYRRIFVTKFNYGFHIPKTDRCDKCETYKILKAERNLTEDEENSYQSHIAEKKAMRENKKKDKESEIPILVFDLENVITCPRTEIGPFFYHSKLSLYNLTAYLTTTKTVYCAIWSEVQQGRSGNCLASAFIKILKRVLEDNDIIELITWSDSCVAQNRNSFISFAILETLRNTTSLQSVTMNYSIAGHGAVQEVDSIHSRIEDFMKKAEFFSPLGFVRNLKKINRNHPYVILQMRAEDFKNYEQCASEFDYKKVPFSKVTSLKFTQELNNVEYKTCHMEENYQSVNIVLPEVHHRTVRNRGGGRVRTRGGINNSKNLCNNSATTVTSALKVVPRTLPMNEEISKKKIDALKKMMATMPKEDITYYKALLHLN